LQQKKMLGTLENVASLGDFLEAAYVQASLKQG
jgi:hypothetical protein